MRDQAKLVGGQYAQALVEQAKSLEGKVASEAWFRAQQTYAFLESSALAIECGERAVAASPSDFAKRRDLAALLVHNQRYAQARPHLQWCLRRRPDDPHLVQLASEAKRQDLAAPLSAATNFPAEQTKR
jgi:thioredoxin-like negative regulator of GroEL